MGDGKVKMLPAEDILLRKDLKQMECDLLMMSLRIDAGAVKEMTGLEWKYEVRILPLLHRHLRYASDGLGGEHSSFCR